MNTSFGESLRGVLAGPHVRRIIALRAARVCALLVMATSLTACTATRLAYNQAHNATYWWLDSHVDFNNGQSTPVRGDINAFFQWHRANELPVYAGLLQRWQTLASQDMTGEQVCAEFDVIRTRLDRAADASVQPMARLALQLDAAQLERLRSRQAKSNAEFEDDFLQASSDKRVDKRFDRALSRSEMLYGSLSTAQKELVRNNIKASPFDPQRTQAERLRRQADLLQTVKEAQAAPETAAERVRGHIARISQSPTPGYKTYSDELVRQGCAQFAQLHNSTTPEQRANAVRVLKGYEDDLRVLSAGR
ncbi:MAG: DUF6279 family lipoprotein [Hydrogenophaga sp.]|uniref:DUF6279 family lipoprotein n=1 Tax=Hydrogenophaga sp. TaxID=1904254 RepID=UPI0025BD4E59|nr:DUF6279 family lipoprotein [Hydrogenophaga sp.]MDO9505905.1 DUF6279 family lipoprotein [Hydrogenophaga sp.]MDP3202569.1 DUF6279 family lipoprotein [Hydrogenophaga sp.]MDP3628864.1 DUF6279 family lipoprotein [Hydrogenophaga sp.]